MDAINPDRGISYATAVEMTKKAKRMYKDASTRKMVAMADRYRFLVYRMLRSEGFSISEITELSTVFHDTNKVRLNSEFKIYEEIPV